VQQYNKPFLPVSGQLEKLKGYGLAVSDPVKAGHYLLNIGYYRLSGYWFPLRQSEDIILPNGKSEKRILDNFREGSDFSQVVDLYVFDKRLRLLMTDVLERIEISLRTNVSLQLGEKDRWAHLNPTSFDKKFTQKQGSKSNNVFDKPSEHEDFLEITSKKYKKSKEEFVKHHFRKYRDPMPIWSACEVWDFGNLSVLLSGLKYKDKEVIGSYYDVKRPELFITWVRTLAFVRNVCAHHSRLWNKPLAAQPRPPRVGDVPLLDHLALPTEGLDRLYAAAAIARLFQLRINPSSSWGARFVQHMATFPKAPAISLEQAGFPEGWTELPLWK
jgi:abortive infection bacteriophage resistance protein